jgi:outer membrane protein, heavy metal efflux system
VIAKKCFNWIRVLVLFVVFALLAACARFEPRPIAPDVTAAAFEARSLSDADLKRFLETHLKRELRPWPAKTWDMMMLTLTALYYHPDMDLARARWAVAEAAVITAGQRPNPTVGMSATHVFTGVPSGVFPWALGLSFDIPIETAGKRGYRIAQARQLSRAAQLNLAQVAWQVRSRMRASLLSLLAAERAHAISQRRLALEEGIVRLLEQRLTLGEASQPEVTQARIALNQEELTGRELQKQVTEARVQLATAVGLPASALADVTLVFAPLEQAPRAQQLPSSEVRRHGLTNRADILSALADYEASEATLQQEIARQYPDVRLGTGYSWELGENRWTLPGIALTLPVFQQNQGPIAEAEARRREAAARFNALQAQALGEIDRSLASARAALKNW